MLSFLYVQRVVDTNSLYGSVGIIVVLMLGLYIFWLLILLGGQITYAVQNADFLTNENAWQLTSPRSREVVSLGILLLVAKRFQQQQDPIRASELHATLRVPSHILNASLNRLCQLSYLYPVERNTGETTTRDRAYQPARPLESMTPRPSSTTLVPWQQRGCHAAGRNTPRHIQVPARRRQPQGLRSRRGTTQSVDLMAAYRTRHGYNPPVWDACSSSVPTCGCSPRFGPSSRSALPLDPDRRTLHYRPDHGHGRLVRDRYRARWVFWFMLAYSGVLLFNPPVGTSVALAIVLFLLRNCRAFLQTKR